MHIVGLNDTRVLYHKVELRGHFGAKALKIADRSKGCSCTSAVVVTHVAGLDVTGVCGINALYE